MPTIYIENKEELPERKELDFYPTPREFVRTTLHWLNNVLDIEPRQILDPGAGLGVWGDEARSVWDHVYITGVELNKPDSLYSSAFDEIHFGDYLEFTSDHKYNLIIGNPPYYLQEEFIDKSFSLLLDGGYLGFLLKLSFLESQKRYNLYFGTDNRRPKHVWVSVRRISFTGDRKSNADAYCFVVWKKGWLGNTELAWLNWEYDK